MYRISSEHPKSRFSVKLRTRREYKPRKASGTDSHGQWQLSFLELGLAAALLGGMKRDRILNFMTGDELLNWVEGVRGSSLPKRKSS